MPHSLASRRVSARYSSGDTSRVSGVMMRYLGTSGVWLWVEYRQEAYWFSIR